MGFGGVISHQISESFDRFSDGFESDEQVSCIAMRRCADLFGAFFTCFL